MNNNLTDLARENWARYDLQYSDINKENFLRLVKILDETLRKNPAGIHDLCVTISPKKYAPIFKKDSRGGMTEAYIRCSSDYFTGREAISFNSDGFIGFCGWASSVSSEPFAEAFMLWLNEILQSALQRASRKQNRGK